MRRRGGLKPSQGTTWPRDVREHIATHQAGCIGPLAGMLGRCDPGIELDHIRASHGMGMKSDSIATNGAHLCLFHHDMKTRNGKTWRPRLIDVNRWLARTCASCASEMREVYGFEIEDPHAGHVDPCPSCPVRVPA